MVPVTLLPEKLPVIESIMPWLAIAPPWAFFEVEVALLLIKSAQMLPIVLLPVLVIAPPWAEVPVTLLPEKMALLVALPIEVIVPLFFIAPPSALLFTEVTVLDVNVEFSIELIVFVGSTLIAPPLTCRLSEYNLLFVKSATILSITDEAEPAK